MVARNGRNFMRDPEAVVGCVVLPWRLRESWPVCHIEKRVIFFTDFWQRFLTQRISQILELSQMMCT